MPAVKFSQQTALVATERGALRPTDCPAFGISFVTAFECAFMSAELPTLERTFIATQWAAHKSSIINTQFAAVQSPQRTTNQSALASTHIEAEWSALQCAKQTSVVSAHCATSGRPKRPTECPAEHIPIESTNIKSQCDAVRTAFVESIL
jgi:hypothetical protein